MQRRLYKKKRKENGFVFAVLCIMAVVTVLFVCVLLARCNRSTPVETTTLPSETSSFIEVIFTPEITFTEEPTSVPETTSEMPEPTAVTVTEDSLPDETTTAATTFTSVAEESGVRRIENFIFCETDTPEYRLARLLLCEIPPVVKTAEVTETVSTEETAEPTETTETTELTASAETSVLTDEAGNAIETTVETYTYEVDGIAAVYYRDLTDGETMVFAPNDVIFGASMIKAVYIFALLQKAELDEIDLTEEVVYTEDMYVEGSGDFKNVKSGTAFTVEELMRRTVRRSDNTAFSMLQKRYGTAFFPEIMSEFSLTPTRFGSWWRTSVSNYGKFFTVLAEYLTAENKYGEWLAEHMCESLQSVMLQRALRPEKVAHKYGWDEDSYCDGAVVLSDTPYVLVFMSNMDEGHTKSANTRFIYEVGGIIKQLHDAKHEALAAAETTEEVTE